MTKTGVDFQKLTENQEKKTRSKSVIPKVPKKITNSGRTRQRRGRQLYPVTTRNSDNDSTKDQKAGIDRGNTDTQAPQNTPKGSSSDLIDIQKKKARTNLQTPPKPPNTKLGRIRRGKNRVRFDALPPPSDKPEEKLRGDQKGKSGTTTECPQCTGKTVQGKRCKRKAACRKYPNIGGTCISHKNKP